MIDFDINKEGALQLRQRDLSPTVYFDHWALRKFSEDPVLTARFAAALGRRNGTLALSWLNLAEFTKVTDAAQARSAENFIEANILRLFFLDTEPFAVIGREDVLLAGGEPVAPHADAEFLKAFAELKPDSVRPFTARGLFQVIQSGQLTGRLDDLADGVVDRVAALRTELDSNLGFRSAVRRLPDGSRGPRATRVILRELVRSLLVDRAMKLTRNHAIDLLHAVVPVAYCDLVLLDRHWETQVDRVRARLDEAGITIPISKAFSAKENGLERFLGELESN